MGDAAPEGMPLERPACLVPSSRTGRRDAARIRSEGVGGHALVRLEAETSQQPASSRTAPPSAWGRSASTTAARAA